MTSGIVPDPKVDAILKKNVAERFHTVQPDRKKAAGISRKPGNRKAIKKTADWILAAAHRALCSHV